MNAAVLSIGTELTRGELVNSNAAWLSEELTTLGLTVLEHVTVDDNASRIGNAIQALSNLAQVVVATGGLGPTSDDLTSASVATTLGVSMFRDEAALENIRRRFAALGRPMPASNTKQAEFPEGADVLPNPIGTAPGFAVTVGSARFFFLPGVPAEMKRIFRDSIVQEVAPRVRRTSHQIHLRCFGMSESQIGETLADLEEQEEGLVLGYRAHFPEIEVKVLVNAESESDAEARARRIAEEVRRRLGNVVYGDRMDTYAGCIGRVLRDKSLTLAVAESCTGGGIGAMLTDVPGSSDYLLLDAVTYSNATKTSVLGVSPDILRAYGAVSAETAAAMAEGALRVAQADLAVSVTGIAGPGGGTEEKPVGTVWFGVACKDRPTQTKRHLFKGDRERVRTFAAYTALRFVSLVANKRSIEE